MVDPPGENPYAPSTTEGLPQGRSVAVSCALAGLVLAASGVAFGATCTVGMVVGANVSANINNVAGEQALGHGLMSGMLSGVVAAAVVFGLLYRLLFRRPAANRGSNSPQSE